MEDIKMVIVVRKDLNMRKGKMCAQVGHAAQQFLVKNNVEKGGFLRVKLSKEEAIWLMTGTTKIVVGCESEDELQVLMEDARRHKVTCHRVIDAGHTEFDGVPTLTCAAFGPAESSIIDKITGKLSLL